MTRPLIIGIGEAGFESLAPELRQRVTDAEIVIAAPRFHAQLPTGPKVMSWPSPFAEIHALIKKNAGRKLVLLATGDPMWFGAGASIARRLGREGCEVIPAPSGLQLAAARLGWPIAECGIVSIHGRPAHTILSRLHPRAKLLVIPRDGKSPDEAADLLNNHGHGKARIHILANIGGKEESHFEMQADKWTSANNADGARDIPDFHIMAIECPDEDVVASNMAAPDHRFDNDGKITRCDVRAAALSKLAPFPGAVLWDIGSGSGAVSIDFLRMAGRGSAHAIDRDAAQCQRATANAVAHGVAGFQAVCADAETALKDLPRPDAVFIGGGASNPVFRTAIARLRPGGVIVAHAVTIETESILVAHWQKHGGDLARLSIQHADPVGGFHGWRPLMPVTRWHWIKAPATSKATSKTPAKGGRKT